MQGMIYVNDYYAAQVKKQNGRLDPLKDYVRNFSELNDIIDTSTLQDSSNVYGFAKSLQ